jgi:hypothetical protein
MHHVNDSRAYVASALCKLKPNHPEPSITYKSKGQQRIERLDHIAVAAKSMTREDYQAIRAAPYPDGHGHLDALMNNVCADPGSGQTPP